MKRAALIFTAVFLLLSGCEEPPAPEQPEPRPEEITDAFESTAERNRAGRDGVREAIAAGEDDLPAAPFEKPSERE